MYPDNSILKKLVLDKSIITRILRTIPSHEWVHFLELQKDATAREKARIRSLLVNSVPARFGFTSDPERFEIDLLNQARRRLSFGSMEIDDLIARCGKRTATLLQLLKETGMRIGEALSLKWIDVDMERNTIRCRAEKHGNPRMFKASSNLISIVNALPKTTEKVFGNSTTRSSRSTYIKQRSLAQKLQNPRLNQITFHTFRHWKATMEYHKTKDILHVKQLLGHRCLESTLVYTQLVDFDEDEEYHVKTAKTIAEACELAEAGFDYFTTIYDVQVFRKRKWS